MNNKNKELGNLWISKANHDLTNAEIILESNREELPFDTVCFHCQQSVEKYLKAFLVFHNKEFPPTHNIANLISRCMDIDKNFEQIMESGESLTPFAVEIRYPDEISMPTEDDAKEALKIALSLKQFVLNKIHISFKINL